MARCTLEAGSWKLDASFQFPASSVQRATAETFLAKLVAKYAKSAPRLADWLEKNIPEGLTVFSFPAAHRRKLRTVNLVERLNRELKRRNRVVSIFPNEAACLRLISALLMETDEAWQTGRLYLTFQKEEPILSAQQ
ncbi:MAG: transposase [Anaerolineae bacterium]